MKWLIPRRLAESYRQLCSWHKIINLKRNFESLCSESSISFIRHFFYSISKNTKKWSTFYYFDKMKLCLSWNWWFQLTATKSNAISSLLKKRESCHFLRHTRKNYHLRRFRLKLPLYTQNILLSWCGFVHLIIKPPANFT